MLLEFSHLNELDSFQEQTAEKVVNIRREHVEVLSSDTAVSGHRAPATRGVVLNWILQ